MSGIGFWELIILSLIGLIVLGPERLPRVANQLGNWLGQARRMTRAMKRQLEDELNFDDDFNPKPPRIAPPPVATDIPDPTDPAYDYDDAPEAHVPNDDDTFSPIHGEEGEDTSDDDGAETEKDA